jgi:putative acetyltransferase
VAEIRRERPEDTLAIRNVNDRAFDQPSEGEVVDQLRESCEGLVSLVAVVEGQVVGHILFSPVALEAEDGLVMDKDAMRGASGPARHRSEFDATM